METATFLSEFPPVSTEQWERAIRETVPDADYAARLIWRPEEGLAVKPYYRTEDLAGLQCLGTAPGDFPYLRGTRITGTWRIRERIEETDPEEANRAACEAVASGAEEISFAHVKIDSFSDLALLLRNMSEIPVHFEGLKGSSIRMIADRLSAVTHGSGVSASVDPLVDLDLSEELIRCAQHGFRPFSIHADEFQELGAGSIEELGFAIAAGVDFFDEILERGLPLERLAGSMAFEFAIGPEFFIQIAKLRAFRILWAKVVEGFGGEPETGKATVYARTAQWNKTMYDPHTNILRATAEAISAVLGGADSLSIGPFDACYRSPEESSRRIARNTQLVLRNEAFLGRITDPLGGSYLIESVTNDVVMKAWRVFQEIEAAGGYRKAKATGVIGSALERSSTSRKKSVATRRLVLTGTNRFANAAERVLDQVDLDRSDPELLKLDTRAAFPFEKLRLRTERAEKNGRSPHILLAEIGEAKMRGARSQFAAEFLAVAGFSVEVRRFESPDQIAESRADVIVLCSSDPEYLTLTEELMPLMKQRGNLAVVLIAGNPESAAALRTLGIFDSVHLKSNAAEVLGRLQTRIGIED